MKPSIVFFDIGGTLTTAMEASPRRLWGMRLNLSEKETRQVGRLIMTEPANEPETLARAVCRILPRRPPAEILHTAQSLWMEQMRSVREVQGAMELLRSLGNRGHRLGILSNTWYPLFHGFTDVFAPVMPLVECRVVSFQEGCKKPSREIFLRAVAKCGLPPDSCWMVGDTYELDMRPAMDIGMRTLWVLSSPERERNVLEQVRKGEMRSPRGLAESLDDARRFLEDKDNLA